ncbi:MAG: HAMP domain-containing histidine kinase [Christensenellaceae bacterium]|nr:HAMP domain-containing histidine kinase [Christensenellaceae bacterium]
MKTSLKVKLWMAFIGIALFLYLTISVLANVVLDAQFKQYTINRLDQKIKDTVALVSESYQRLGRWDAAALENIGVNALEEGLMIRVTDGDGAVLWDSREHNNGLCMAILKNMAENMRSYNTGFKGGYEEREFAVDAGGAAAGKVAVGYYGPYFYSDLDIQFLGTLNSLLLWAALGSVAVCLVFGAYMARRLTNPIARVVKAAGRIAKGDFNDRIDEESSTKEIAELTDSINTLAQTLGSQEALRKRLTADVAHELRTPLATLQSHVEAFIDGVWEPNEARLKGFHEEILRLTKLVGELEQLSRYESENLVLNVETFDLAELVRGVAANFESEFTKKGIEVSLDTQEQYIEADRDKISQVFINLISNALKFTGEGGRVEIRVSGTPHAAKAEVRDTGVGISAEDLPYIFERFYRTDKSRNRATGGAGIGLAIVKSIVEAHKGSVTVESEPDKGSAFFVTLPKSARNGRTAENLDT